MGRKEWASAVRGIFDVLGVSLRRGGTPRRHLRFGLRRERWVWVGLLAMGLPVGAAPFSEEELAGLVERQAADYFAAFQHPETGVLYGTRLASKKSFATPEEVLVEKPHPWGYGSRIADTVLHTGHLLVALLDAYEARPEPWMQEQIAKHFAGLKLIGSLPETHPKKGKPMLEGVVPRGPHPDAMEAWYDDSSMDQHTTYIIALARYATSELASAEEKRWIAESLGKVGRRLEGNGWRILRADGVTEAHVGFSWLGMNSNHASILLPAVAALYAGTGDGHWKELYEVFLSEREGKRWVVMHPGEHVRINGHPIYANQNAFRLNAYWRFEEDVARREVIGGLMEQSVALQLGRDFPGEMFRKFQEEATWKRLREVCGWKDANLHGAAEAWGRFRPEMLEGKDAGLAALAHVRFPLGGYHMALLSEDRRVWEEHVPEVWKMLSTVELEDIAAGETHYLFTVVGLHLYARVFGGDEKSKGSKSRRVDESKGETFGEEFEIGRSLGIGGGVNDVVVDGEFAYAIGRGRVSLSVLDISDRGEPKVVGTLGGLGKTRQLVVQDGVVYVGSREDGLFVVDVSEPTKPRFLKHYDALEFATGMAISGDVLFVACRHYGVELVDVRDPSNPRHLSSIRTGEAQSVDVRGDVLYVGVWASSEVVVVDVADARAPVITERVALDGYGDGVDVVGDYLYASTGHHSKEQPRKKMGDPGFGRGHGLEIFRFGEEGKLEWVSRVKFPRLYERGNDTWRVRLANGRAFCADTYNGMFVVDVRDAEAPVIVGRCEMPIYEKDGRPGFVGGLWPVEDFVYVAGGTTDLHVVAMEGVAKEPVVELGNAPVIGDITRRREDVKKGGEVYLPAGQVHGVDFLEDGRAVVACGAAGVHVVEFGEEVKRLSVLETDGFATDVAVWGERVLVAAGTGGLSVCEVEGDSLVRVARFRELGTSVRQVEMVGEFAFIVDGGTRVRMLDLSDAMAPLPVMTDNQSGLLYGDQLMRGTMEGGRYGAAFWHVSGLHWYDLEAKPAPVHSGDNWAARFGSPNGLFSMGDKVLVTTRGGYMLVGRDERRPLEDVPLYRVGEKPLHLGKPTVFGNELYCAGRASGLVTIAEVSNLMKPRLVEQFVLRGNPGRIAVSEDWVVIPAGVEGLLVFGR